MSLKLVSVELKREFVLRPKNMPYLNYTVGLFNIYLAKGPKLNVI